MNTSELAKPFPSNLVRTRPGSGGRIFSFVPTAAVIRRLNACCERWDFSIEQYQILDGEVVVLGRLVADGIVKVDFGTASIGADASGDSLSTGSALKGAASDALKRAARLLGVALELWDSPAGTTSTRPSIVQTGPEPLLTERQGKAIESLAERRGMSPEALGRLLQAKVGKEQVDQLTRGDASTVIRALGG